MLHLVAHLCCDSGVRRQAMSGADGQDVMSSRSSAARVHGNGSVARQELFKNTNTHDMLVQTAAADMLHSPQSAD